MNVARTPHIRVGRGFARICTIRACVLWFTDVPTTHTRTATHRRPDVRHVRTHLKRGASCNPKRTAAAPEHMRCKYAIHTISSPEWLSVNVHAFASGRHPGARVRRRSHVPKHIIFWQPRGRDAVARASILLRNRCCNLDRVAALRCVNTHV